MALNIQRARDHGLPDYNSARESFGLPRITEFSQINPVAFGIGGRDELEMNTTREVSSLL